MSRLTNPLAAGIAEEYDVVWEALPGLEEFGGFSSQALALDSRADHTLLCGTRGGGKTETQLMRFFRRVGLGYGRYWHGIIFDLEYKNLDDLVLKSKKLFEKFNIGDKATDGKWYASGKDYKWVWGTGEELLFRAVKKKTDYDGYHGHEYPFIGWNELTKYATPTLYDKFMSCNRSSFLPEEHTPHTVVDAHTDGAMMGRDGVWRIYQTSNGLPLPPLPLEVFSTTNPSGIGHNWVKLRFIDVATYGHVVKTQTLVFNPQTQKEEEITTSQVAIFSHWRENRYLDPKYIAGLKNEPDPNVRKAWYTGSWDVTAGGAFDDLWRRENHVIQRFKVPLDWRIDRAFDWGSTHPFAVCWFAECNGEEVWLDNADGTRRRFCPPVGSLILIADWYGTQAIGTNRGLGLSARKVAQGIKSKEMTWISQGWFHSTPWRGPADNQIRDVKDVEQETIATLMENEGVYWKESDKSGGSRKIGMELFRGMLENTNEKNEGPHFYVMDNCTSFIAVVPHLPRDEDKLDDVDTDSEDHEWDATRYRVLKGKARIVKGFKINVAT